MARIMLKTVCSCFVCPDCADCRKVASPPPKRRWYVPYYRCIFSRMILEEEAGRHTIALLWCVRD